MTYLTAFISLQFIILTAYWLIKKYNPQGVLLTTGILMFIVAALIGIPNTAVESGTGSVFFDIFKTVSETFSANMLRGGLMIVTIGGYIAYMKSIKASDALVHITMQPLSLLRKYPYLAACCIIPIGQILFICIPSATGLGLLLAASIYPVLLRLGVSKLTAISVISACTVFDIGPGSANTMRAAELAEMNNLRYFLEFQLPVVVPMTIIMTVAYYFSSRYFDRKDKRKNADPDAVPEGGKTDASAVAENTKPDVPGIYAIFPLLPLILLILFSNYINIFGAIELDITTAIIV